MKILDLWCWEANNKHGIYNKSNHVYGVDINQSNIDACIRKHPSHSFIKVDWKILPFEDEFFDIIQSLDVLEHVDNLDIVLSEAVRVLKKGGEFIIEVPYWKSEERFLKINSEYWTTLHHVRMFMDGELESLLRQYGLSLCKKQWLKFFENITLWYSLKRGNLLNQRWETEVNPPHILSYINYIFIREAALMSLKAKFIILPLYLLTSPIRWVMNKIFPKSIYFVFQKL